MTRRRIAGTASLLAFTLASAPATSRAGAVAPTLPFTPPAGFFQLPPSILPKDPTSWTHGPAVFTISRMPDGIRLPIADVANVVQREEESHGAPTTSKRLTVCGKPAIRMTSINHDTTASTTEQIQSLGASTYLLSYIHPLAVGTDDRIAHVLGTFCGLSGTATPAPPPGWRESETRLLGLWLSPEQQTVTVLQSAPEADFATKARTMMSSTVKSKNVVLLSETEGKLCGLPSITIVAKATTGTAVPTDITFELTQSKTQAFSAIYTRLESQRPNAEALASLASLCAARPVAPAALPTPAAPETLPTPVAPGTPVAGVSPAAAASPATPPSPTPASPTPASPMPASPGASL